MTDTDLDFLKVLFDQSPDAQFILCNGTLEFGNNATAELLGVETSALTGINPFSHSPEYQPNGEKSVTMGLNYLNEAIEIGDACFEWLHDRKGENIWTEYVLKKVEWNGQTCLHGIARDVTRHVHKHEESRERIERLIHQNQALTEISGAENRVGNSLSEFRELINEKVAETLEVDQVSIWSLGSSGKLSCEDSYNATTQTHSEEASLDLASMPRLEKALQDQGLIVANDAIRDPRTNQLRSMWKTRKRPKGESEPTSVMLAPLVSNNRTLGVFWVETFSQTARIWQFEEQSFVVSIAEIVSKKIGDLQKQKVERKLEKSEKIFKALLEQSLDVVCIVQEEGHLTYHSPSFCRVLGYSNKELRKVNVFKLIHTEDLETLRTRFLKLIAKDGEEDSFLFRIQHKNGHWVYIEALVNNLLKDPEIKGIVVNFRDTTERIQFQEAIVEKEKYYRSLIEKSLDVTLVRDRNGLINYISPSVETVLGMPEKSFLGKGEFELTHPEDTAIADATWNKVLKTPGKPFRFDQRLKLPNGEVRYIEGTVRNLLNISPINGVVANFRDATSRKKAEAALLESQLRLEGIISSAMDAIITVDSNQQIVLFNEAAEKMFDQNATDVFGQPLDLLIPNASKKDHFKNVQTFAGSPLSKKKMQIKGKQLSGLRSDGSEFPIDASISKQTLEEEIFFTAIVRDISEQIKSEKVLKEYNKTLEKAVEARTRLLNAKNNQLNKALQELQDTQEQLVESEKMASLGQLTAGIAHEINNPINFVSSTISPLKRDFDEIQELISRLTSPDKKGAENGKHQELVFLLHEMNELLDGIEEGATRTKNIVLGLRNFSRLDENSFKKVDIHNGLDSTLMLLNSRLKGMIEVKKKYARLPLIECLPGKINQVFMNIISNAIQAIADKGVIKIKTELKDPQTISVSISDTGAGMSTEVRKRIFEPFFTTKDVGVGTGLGLSISYGIIENHKGKIEVRSKPGKGTTFVIYLPVSQI